MTRGAPDLQASTSGAAPRPSAAARTGLAAIPLDATFDTLGPEDGPPIVLLHGTRLTRSMWQPQRPLADTYRLVLVDLPGHGSLARIPFSLPGASAHVGRVIRAATRGRAVVVGQSLGGYVAMDLAVTHPEQVRALVLCSCTQEPRTIARTAPGVVGSYLARAAAQSRQRRPGRAAPRGIAAGPGSHDQPPTEGWLFRGGTRALFTSLGMTFIPRLRAFDGPTLIVNGAGDQLFRRGEASFLAAAKDGRLHVIDGAHHVACEEAPDAWNAVIRDFVKGLDSR